MNWMNSLTLRWRLLAIALVAEGTTFAVSASALVSYRRMVAANDETWEVVRARGALRDADMMHDALRGDLYWLVLGDDDEVVRAQIQADASRMRGDLERAGAVPVERLSRTVAEARPVLDGYIASAERLAQQPTLTVADLAGFEAQFEAARDMNERLLAAAETEVQAGIAHEDASRTGSLAQILVGGLLSLVGVLALTHLLARSIVHQLAGVGQVAQRVVAGEIGARTALTGTDEVASLGQAFDAMADSLTTAMARLEEEAHRDGFRAQLVEALEMADEEEAALDVVRRAMVEVDRNAPMELLLSDSSRAHLHQVAASPAAGPPGCRVQSPFACVAVRRGTAVSFPDSDALNACVHLRNRSAGACSAACVPITFMGRALGVLHAVSSVEQPLSADQVGRLSTLATQAGARIGTVRAFQKTQLQASTDGLTGLINRRTLENEVRALLTAKVPFALAVADLDKFKTLNDTHGHEAGDRALRTFSRVLKSVLRSVDVAARLGGEEFVVVLPRCDVETATTVLERIRAALAATEGSGHPRFTASFGLTHSGHAENFETLLAIGDAALYRAKAEGRDRILLGSPTDVSSDRPIVAAPSNQTSAAGLLIPRRRPAMHEVADEEDPRPSGLEIR